MGSPYNMIVPNQPQCRCFIEGPGERKERRTIAEVNGTRSWFAVDGLAPVTAARESVDALPDDRRG
jgi:hypothetical protein